MLELVYSWNYMRSSYEPDTKKPSPETDRKVMNFTNVKVVEDMYTFYLEKKITDIFEWA